MKQSIYLIGIIMCWLFLSASWFGVYAEKDNKKKRENETKEVSDTTFLFKYYPNLFEYDTEGVSQKNVKSFGEEVASLIIMLDEACVKYGKSESDYKPRMIKPTLYNAMTKTIGYFRKEIKQGKISKEAAVTQLSALLRKGYVCVFEETDELEDLLAEANTPVEIISIMDKVSISAY